MSCWHDPRGRLIVDGEGRTVRDGDEVRRLVPGHHGPTYGNAAWLADRGVTWMCCGWVPMSIDAPPCDGLIVVLPSRRYSTGDRVAPHECRSQRRWPDGET